MTSFGEANVVAGTLSRRAAAPVAAGVAGIVLCALATVVVLTSEQGGNRPLIALGRVLVFAVPIAVGLWAWGRPAHERFGRLLVAAGFVWFFTTLAESSDSLVYSVGRIAGWVAEPVVILLMLAYPSGRLTTALERRLVWAAVLIVAFLYLPAALLAERYPEPSFWASCGRDCPENAFMLVETQPAFVDPWLRGVRELLTALLFLAVAGLLGRRLRGASTLLRRTLTPVLAIAIARCLLMVSWPLVREASPGSAAVDVVSWAFVLCLPAMALAFFVGLLRMELLGAHALQRLAPRIRDHAGTRELRGLLADALGDPSVELAYWVPAPRGRWVDSAGRPLELPPDGSGRSVTEVRDGDNRRIALVHDDALSDQPDFVEAAASFALAAVENQRLAAQVEASLGELRRSRARIQAAADSERRRIERDLHDGAQQRIVALRVRLELADELIREDPQRGGELFRELGAEVEEALEEVRALASGIYPPLLADRGLGEALRAVALRASLPTRVESQGLDRYPQEIEAVVYFCCLEALQNAAKHARGATRVVISIVDDGTLRFSVSDDGDGFADAGEGSGAGLVNMRDRLAAVGGEFAVESAPTRGTVVSGLISEPRAD